MKKLPKKRELILVKKVVGSHNFVVLDIAKGLELY